MFAGKKYRSSVSISLALPAGSMDSIDIVFGHLVRDLGNDAKRNKKDRKKIHTHTHTHTLTHAHTQADSNVRTTDPKELKLKKSRQKKAGKIVVVLFFFVQ